MGPDGSPLPTDSAGRFVVGRGGEAGAAGGEQPEEEAGRILPTDQTGREIYPIVGADDGRPLPMDASGRHVGLEGEEIVLDDHGRPLDHMGRVLATNERGEYVYRAPASRAAPTTTPTPVLLVGPDGLPLATDSSGRPVPGGPIDNSLCGRPEIFLHAISICMILCWEFIGLAQKFDAFL